MTREKYATFPHVWSLCFEKLGCGLTNYLSHGQPVFKKGRRYITPDIDGHTTRCPWRKC
ncbi:MAG: hypothetical protein GY811_24120 [Myxococcales bacterium]|nr:hypothetical protein [Myxococcales bacterium]